MYSRIDTSAGERHRSPPTLRHPSRQDAAHFGLRLVRQEQIPLSDANPLIVRDGSHKQFDDSQRSTIFESSESEVWESEEYSKHNYTNATRGYLASRWTTYNPLTAAGRSNLRRKILASGPAAITELVPSRVRKAEPREPTTGWRAGTRICCAAVALCLIVELALLIYAVLGEHGTSSGILYEGECATVRTAEVWLLLPLNIAATILIGTSNYVMQVMTAPSREEIDLAHDRCRYMLVGGIGFNTVVSSRKGGSRRIIWWIIALSSLPIHLLLNVAFYSSLQVSDTGILVVSENFTEDPTWDLCDTDLPDNSIAANFTCELKRAFTEGKTQELSPSQCLAQYTLGFQTNASSLIVVTSSDATSWYNLPLTAKLPDKYGIPCSMNESDRNSWSYFRNDTLEPSFEFLYFTQSGSAIVRAEYNLMCRNNTSPSGSQLDDLTIDEAGQRWYYEPISSINSFESTRTLFFQKYDSLANIESVRSVFSAAEYRYWATASDSGDYLDPQLLSSLGGWETSSWVCPASSLTASLPCDPTKLDVSSGWKITPAEFNVKTCHILAKKEYCALRYSLKILIITMCCDVVKIAAMVAALRLVTLPLTTLGDVIKSFLQRPDPYTKDRCLLDNDEATKWPNRVNTRAVHEVRRYLKPQGLDWQGSCRELWRGRPLPPGLHEATPFQVEAYDYLMGGTVGLWWSTAEPPPKDNAWDPTIRRWSAVPTGRRWMCFAILYLTLMLSVIVHLAEGMKLIYKQGFAFTWAIGFGGPDPRSMWTGGLLDGTMNITWVAVLVNSPQVLFSMMYFVVNASLTLMHTAHEWSLFAVQRKALRVSSPQGRQRATYWLQLPWSFSIPLIVASGSLHWLLSRSIYVVRVDVFGFFDERLVDKDFFACGYSPITIVLLIVVLGLMGSAVFLISRRRLTPGMPFARLNSLAIAAACHPNPAEKDIALHPVMWGVIDEPCEDGVLHCSFSAREVSPLSKGTAYM